MHLHLIGAISYRRQNRDFYAAGRVEQVDNGNTVVGGLLDFVILSRANHRKNERQGCIFHVPEYRITETPRRVLRLGAKLL